MKKHEQPRIASDGDLAAQNCRHEVQLSGDSTVEDPLVDPQDAVGGGAAARNAEFALVDGDEPPERSSAFDDLEAGGAPGLSQHRFMPATAELFEEGDRVGRHRRLLRDDGGICDGRLGASSVWFTRPFCGGTRDRDTTAVTPRVCVGEGVSLR